MKRLSTLVIPSIVAVSLIVALAGLTILAELGERSSVFNSSAPGDADSPGQMAARTDVALPEAADLSDIAVQGGRGTAGQFALGRTTDRERPAGRAERDDEALRPDRGEEPGDRIARAVQLALQREGLDVGEADGVIGSRTESALRQFQDMHGLMRSGPLDRETLAALHVEAGASVGLAGGPLR
jgi:Putative peptidoglycan binding domain